MALGSTASSYLSPRRGEHRLSLPFLFPFRQKSARAGDTPWPPLFFPARFFFFFFHTDTEERLSRIVSLSLRLFPFLGATFDAG